MIIIRVIYIVKQRHYLDSLSFLFNIRIMNQIVNLGAVLEFIKFSMPGFLSRLRSHTNVEATGCLLNFLIHIQWLCNACI